MTTKEPNQCQICGKPAIQGCTICGFVQYCSQACQVHDKDIHNILCRLYSDSQHIPEQPSDDHYAAILFPEKANVPRPVWLYGTEESDGSGRKIKVIEIAAYVRPTQSSFMVHYEANKGVFLLCNHSDSSSDDDLKKNFCLDQIEWLLSGQKSTWKGPVLGYSVVAGAGPDREQSHAMWPCPAG